MFKKSLLIMLLTAMFAPWAVGQSTVYQKVTENKTDWSGKYIFANSDASKGASSTINTSGYLASPVDLTISGINITNTNGAAVFEIQKITGSSYYLIYVDDKGYLRNNSDKLAWYNYSYGGESYLQWEITFSNNAFSIKNQSTSSVSKRYLIYQTQFVDFELYSAASGYNRVPVEFYEEIEITGCPKPSVTASTVGSRTATINWFYPGTDTYTYFEYICSETAITDFTDVTGTAVTGTSKELTGLTPETPYYCYVRTVCDANNDEYSDWSNACTFTTQVACPVPTGLTCTSYTATTASLEWTSTGAESYEIYLTTTENDVPGENTSATTTSSSNSKLIENLTAETTYYAYVRGNCGSTDGKSDWSVVCPFTPSAAQDITVNNEGTTTTNYNVPFYGSYADDTRTHGQYIIPASKLESVTFGEIKKLTLYGSTNYNYTATFSVKLAEVSQTTLDGFYTGSMTEVYSGTLAVAGENHAMEIPFVSNYTYNGGNLLVDFSISVAGNYQSQSWMVISTSTNTACSKYSSGNPTNYKYLPTTTVTYIPGSEPDCYTPKDLQADNITASSADLSWTKSGLTTTCKLQYRAAGASEWLEKNDVAEPYTSYTLSGLNANTTYEYQVMGVCNGEDTDWSYSCIFTTDCGAYNLPYSYGFESNTDMSCWTVISGNSETGIYTYSNVGYESNSTFRFVYTKTVDQYLFSPELSGVTSLGVKVTFYYKKRGSYDETFQVGYSTTTCEAASFEGNWDDEITTENSSWNTYSHIFPAGTKYIAISYPKNDNYGLYIDNISFKTPENTYTTEGNWNDNTKWSYGTLPTDADDVIINAACIIPANCIATANSITFGENGSLTIADGGQLIHPNPVNATLQKTITGASTWNEEAVDGWYTITPTVASYDKSNFGEVGTYDLYLYNEPTHYWWNANGTDHSFSSMAAGRGYLFASQNTKTISYTGEMQGTSDYVSTELSNTESAGDLKGFNLVGNRFTRNLVSGDVKLGDNPLTTYYVAEGGSDLVARDLTSNPIKPGQGFIVQANGQSHIYYNSSNAKGAMAYKPAFIRIEAGNERFMDRAYVQIGQGNTLRKMTLSDEVSHLYVMDNGKDYAAVTIEEAQGEMPVNFKANENGQYTLTVKPEGVEMNYLHLVDNMTGMDVDLLQTPSYSFNAKTTDYESRFRLVFAANNNNNEDGPSTGSGTFAFFSNGSWIINNEGEATLQVIDLNGRILSSETINGSVSKSINATTGIYMMRLISGDDVKTQKVVVR